MELGDMCEIADRIRVEYAARNSREQRPEWSELDYAAGLAGDVGDLIKLVQAREHLRSYDGPNLQAALTHELNDCLWSILAIANMVGVDLADSFPLAMSELLDRAAGDTVRVTRQRRSARSRTIAKKAG